MLKPINDQQVTISNRLRSGHYIVNVNERESSRQPMSANDSLEVRKLGKQLDSLSAAEKPILKKFIQSNPGSYISLVDMWNYGGSFPDLSVMEPLYNRLSASLKNNSLGREYYKFLMDRKNMGAGTKAPDFVQNDTSATLSAFPLLRVNMYYLIFGHPGAALADKKTLNLCRSSMILKIRISLS